MPKYKQVIPLPVKAAWEAAVLAVLLEVKASAHLPSQLADYAKIVEALGTLSYEMTSVELEGE